MTAKQTEFLPEVWKTGNRSSAELLSSAELVFIYKPPAKAVRLLFSLLARCFCWSVADCRVAAGLLLIAALLLVELIGELLLCAGRADCHRPPSLRSGMFRKSQKPKEYTQLETTCYKCL